MHFEVYQWLRNELFTENLAGKAVLEIGAYDVNGSPRPLLVTAARYHGIDVRAGKGVDEVIGAADYDGKGAFDYVISSETMEHMAHPEEVIACALKALKPGGLLLLTAAAPEREPHNVDGGKDIPKGEAYNNVDPQDLQAWLAEWDGVQLYHHSSRGDVYARARAPQPPVEVKTIKTKKTAAAVEGTV